MFVAPLPTTAREPARALPLAGLAGVASGLVETALGDGTADGVALTVGGLAVPLFAEADQG